MRSGSNTINGYGGNMHLGSGSGTKGGSVKIISGIGSTNLSGKQVFSSGVSNGSSSGRVYMRSAAIESSKSSGAISIKSGSLTHGVSGMVLYAYPVSFRRRHVLRR